MSSLFPGLDSLIGLARHGVDVKPTLLRVLTDLYVQKPTHTTDEERQFVELSLRLIDVVDATTRDMVARRLAAYPGAPVAVLARLDGRVIESLPAPAPAPRPGTLPEDPASATMAFFSAGDAERRDMLQALDSAEPLEATGWPVPSEEIARRLEASVLGGRPVEFIHEIARSLGVSRALAERIVNDRGGEPLVVVARALAMPVATLQRILLFVNPAIGHSVRRVYALTELFEATSVAAALRLTACWRAAEPVEGRRPTAPAHPAGRAPLGTDATERLAPPRRLVGDRSAGAARLPVIDKTRREG